jgi:DNA phosphorothioation-associated putative methyltransferase
MTVGKLVRGALYVHRSAVPELPALERSRLNIALAVATPAEWNVARVEGIVVAFLEYEDFDISAFPALLASTRVDLATGTFVRTDYRRSGNPLILHRKEQLMSESDPRTNRWGDTTRRLVELGMFKDNHLISRRTAWLNRLAAAGVTVDGDQVTAS